MTPNSSINVSVSSHYREPSYSSEITSQGILGERVEVIDHHPPFTRILQADGYESWVSTDQVHQGAAPAGTDIMVRSHFMRIYREPSIFSEGVKDAVIGCTLTAEAEEEGWYMIVLPDGSKGWAEKRHFGIFPEFSEKNITRQAREFLGYQYLWGGRSPKGLTAQDLFRRFFSFLASRCPGILGNSSSLTCSPLITARHSRRICSSSVKRWIMSPMWLYLLVMNALFMPAGG